jgi:cyclopropane fatty-acyl-phospholipid synthase-like methyltransferase
MESFYQTEWHGIKFNDVTIVSSEKLAESDFYNSFYAAFFKKYFNYEELDPSWRQTKDEIADWISNQVKPGFKVLSVGCGLGYMETKMYKLFGSKIQLHVSDFA